MLGLLFIGFGLIVLPILPAAQLDVVLTPAQLRDDALREQTLAMLQKAGGNQWLLWVTAGCCDGG